MMLKILLLLVTGLLCSCGHRDRQSPLPLASTAAVGIKLDELEGSLGRANESAGAAVKSLDEVDAKAARIKEAIRNW